MDRTVLRGESAPRTPFKVEVLRTGKIMTRTGTGCQVQAAETRVSSWHAWQQPLYR